MDAIDMDPVGWDDSYIINVFSEAVRSHSTGNVKFVQESKGLPGKWQEVSVEGKQSPKEGEEEEEFIGALSALDMGSGGTVEQSEYAEQSDFSKEEPNQVLLYMMLDENYKRMSCALEDYWWYRHRYEQLLELRNGKPSSTEETTCTSNAMGPEPLEGSEPKPRNRRARGGRKVQRRKMHAAKREVEASATAQRW